jgi:AcrR family transcriptional regulator
VNIDSCFWISSMKSRSSWIADLRWARPVHQQRSQRTLERLLDSAEAVIAEKGFADAAVADIAERAGCSVGTFYRRFRDKDALLHALDERLAEELRATLDDAVSPERWEGARIAEILEGYLQFALEVGRPRVVLARAARLMAQRDTAFAERHARMTRELHDRLAALLRARVDEIGHPEPAVAIDFALEQLRAMLQQRLEEEPLARDLLAVSDARFIDEALRSVTSYLRTPAPAAAPSAEAG